MTVRGEMREIAPAANAYQITPSDANFIPKTRGLMIGAAGVVVVEMAGGQIVTLNELAAGIIHPMQVIRVLATGTTATGIVGYR